MLDGDPAPGWATATERTDEDTLINPDGNVVPQGRLLLADQGVVEQGRDYEPRQPSPSKGRLLL